jgi:hypothetical protein
MRVRRRCLWHPRHACARRRASAPRTARFRRSVKSVGRFRPQVPSLVTSAPPCSAAFATGLGCARHPGSIRPCEAAPELLCPFDEGVSPPSPEPRLGPLNFSKERELGRGPLVELPAIVLSIREHDPRFVDTRLAAADLLAELGLSAAIVRSRFAYAARRARHPRRSRDADDNLSISRRAARQTPRVARK